MWQLAASASPGLTSSTRASAWTVRYQTSMRTSRLKEILQHVRGRQSFCQSCHAFVGRSRSDHSRQQGTKKTSHPRRRWRASLVPAQRHTLPLHSGSLWGAIQCSMVERHGSRACTPLPPVPFHSTWWMAVCRRFPLVWKRQRHRSWQHAFAVFCTFWDVVSVGTRLHCDAQVRWIGLDIKFFSCFWQIPKDKRDKALQITQKVF